MLLVRLSFVLMQPHALRLTPYVLMFSMCIRFLLIAFSVVSDVSILPVLERYCDTQHEEV